MPVKCIERCVALPDCAMFNPTRPQADFNERRPFEALEQDTTEMVLYPAEVGTAPRWRRLTTSHHSVPCFARGIVTGFEALLSTIRTGVAARVCQQRSGSGGAGEETRVVGARTKAEVFNCVPDMFWHVIEAVARTYYSEKLMNHIAFSRQHGRKNSEISLPRYHVFTIAFSPRGEWEKVVATVLAHLCCG
ncbi:hypothetical protein CGC20_32820 [Leishmania donovani]|uniref:Uncharacterized protein n=1 Tax=Leishmania donovani TaxID=5661 RepID=A0A504XJ12_LEIDO|nr:hypothetical protein CGC20_32820 [Leishmania donovani]